MPERKTIIEGLLLLSLFLFFSCSHHDEPSPKVPTTAEKTILMFLPYSGDNNNLYANFQQNISDIEQAIANAGGLRDCRLLVFISLTSSRAALVDIAYRNGQCHRDTLYRYNQPALSTVEGIANILNDTKVSAPAHQYALIVGSHGEGWLPVKHSAKARATRYFGGTSGLYQIEIATLARAIDLADMHMQFILFDDCYLSTIEVAYDLRHTADYLIASTSEIMAYGMPYHLLFPILTSPLPDYTAICQQFLHFYENYKNDNRPMPYGTLAVTDLRQVDNMAILMHEINSQCIFDTSQTESLQDLDASHWTPTIYFDFGDYADYLCGERRDLYARFEEQLAKLVICKAATENIYSAAGKTILPLHHFSGLAISDPSTNESISTSKQQTAWWTSTH